MKLIMLAFPVLAAVLLAGCNDPAPVELLPPPDTSGFEIVAIAAVDTSTDSPQVDSTAVLPADRVRFALYQTWVELQSATSNTGDVRYVLSAMQGQVMSV